MIKRLTQSYTKKQRRKVYQGIFHIKGSLHNTLITVTDTNGNVLGWSSGGASGFKSKKKSSPFAAQVTTSNVLTVAKEYTVRHTDVTFKGLGKARDTALRTILQNGLTVSRVRDVTPLPHNGCRAPKRRRI